VKKIASYATMKTTDWTVVINAPKEEFMGTINSLRLSMIGIGETTGEKKQKKRRIYIL